MCYISAIVTTKLILVAMYIYTYILLTVHITFIHMYIHTHEHMTEYSQRVVTNTVAC